MSAAACENLLYSGGGKETRCKSGWVAQVATAAFERAAAGLFCVGGLGGPLDQIWLID